MYRSPRSKTLAAALVVLLIALAAPPSVSAQLGAIEAFARRVTDLSFNASLGTLAPTTGQVHAESLGLRSFGLELLFEISAIAETRPGTESLPPDSAQLAWTRMIVDVGAAGADTTYVYEVREPTRRPPPADTTWIFEMGIGYGQLVGFDSTDPNVELYGQVRELPSASVYASYEPVGAYFGMRSGFMSIQGLRAYDPGGEAFTGTAESFLLAGVVGSAVEVLGFNVFLEGAYSIRHFPSVEWRALSPGTPLDSSLPREMSFSGWSVGTGIQFAIGE